MNKFDIVFCVLTYRNHTDLEEFIESLKGNKKLNFTYKIVVVNNYADFESLKKIRDIAILNDCVFIESENKGYGNGNNLGISFIKDNFDYEFLVVCNPDTMVVNLDIRSLKGLNNKIIGPEISCLNGKLQNPMNFSYMPISEKILYIGFKKNIRMMVYIGIALIKINNLFRRKLMIFKKNTLNTVHACHGSFIIFGNLAIKQLYPVFDDNIFLFGEEGDLAQKARRQNVDILYKDNIKIIHKEDGSMKQSNINISNTLRKSYLYYYEKWNAN